MNHLKNALKVDFQRSLCSFSFLVTMVFIILWMALNGWDFFTSERTRIYNHPAYVMNISTISFERPTYLILVIATIAYAWSYCQDKDSGYLEQVVGRVGVRAYSVSKVITTAVSAFLACVIAMGIYTAFLNHYFQGQDPIETLGGAVYLNTAGAGKTELYFLMRFTTTGLTCSLSAVFGLMVTAYLPNAYVAFLTPLMSYYSWDIIISVLHIRARWSSLYVLMFSQLLEDDRSSFLVSTAEFLLLIALVGVLFCRKLRKEQTE